MTSTHCTRMLKKTRATKYLVILIMFLNEFGCLRKSLTRRESLSCLSESYENSRASCWTRPEFNIAWIQTISPKYFDYWLVVWSLNIAQRDSYGFSRSSCRSGPIIYFIKNVSISNTNRNYLPWKKTYRWF